MNDFVQMDIFFFISSIVAIIFLLFTIIVGVYVFIIIKKIKQVIKLVQDFALYATSEGKKSITDVQERIENILNNGGVLERMVVTTLGTIIAKTFKSHGKIRKDAPKKK